MFSFSKKKPAKSPRFFCESCGLEVPRDAERCSNCGKYFSSIRCPSCEFTGEEGLFNEGCPVCGYSAKEENKPAPKNNQKTRVRYSAASLPLWVYIITILAFVLVMAALLRTIF